MTRAEGTILLSYTDLAVNFSLPYLSFNCITISLLGNFLTPTTPTPSTFLTTLSSTILFAVVYRALHSIVLVIRTLTSRSERSSPDGRVPAAATDAHVRVFFGAGDVGRVIGGVRTPFSIL